jgi:hypothetical protein
MKPSHLLMIFAAPLLLGLITPRDAQAETTCRQSYGGQTFCSDGTTIRESRNGSTYVTTPKTPTSPARTTTCRQSKLLGTVCE